MIVLQLDDQLEH